MRTEGVWLELTGMQKSAFTACEAALKFLDSSMFYMLAGDHVISPESSYILQVEGVNSETPGSNHVHKPSILRR